MASPDITIERLRAYSPEDAADLGVLRQQMSTNRSRRPIEEEALRNILDHEDRVLVAARAVETGRIVGCETLVTIPVPEAELGDADAIAWLGFVATHSDYRGQGIVKKVTLDGLRWCDERGIERIKFTSNSHNPEREAARGFYVKYGARVVAAGVGALETDLFEWWIEDGLAALNGSR